METIFDGDECASTVCGDVHMSPIAHDRSFCKKKKKKYIIVRMCVAFDLKCNFARILPTSGPANSIQCSTRFSHCIRFSFLLLLLLYSFSFFFAFSVFFYSNLFRFCGDVMMRMRERTRASGAIQFNPDD